MPNEEEIVTQENDTEQVEETEEVEQEQEETVDDLRKKLATAVAQKEHWRTKANVQKEEAPVSTNLSNADLLAVMKANVHEDDMERVERFAKMDGTTVREALKSPELKAILSLREEQRTTATATNVANVRRGVSKVADDVLISNATAGKLPDSDDDIERLIAAKLKRK